MLIWQEENSSSRPTRKHLRILIIAKPMLNAECKFPNFYLSERLWFRDTDNSSGTSDLKQILPLVPLSHPSSLSAVPRICWTQVSLLHMCCVHRNHRGHPLSHSGLCSNVTSSNVIPTLSKTALSPFVILCLFIFS